MRRQEANTESTTSVMMTRAVSSHKCNRLANCRPLNVSPFTVVWLLYGQSKKLLFVPTASAMAGIHRDRLFVASFAQQPEIQCFVFWGQSGLVCA